MYRSSPSNCIIPHTLQHEVGFVNIKYCYNHPRQTPYPSFKCSKYPVCMHLKTIHYRDDLAIYLILTPSVWTGHTIFWAVFIMMLQLWIGNTACIMMIHVYW